MCIEFQSSSCLSFIRSYPSLGVAIAPRRHARLGHPRADIVFRVGVLPLALVPVGIELLLVEPGLGPCDVACEQVLAAEPATGGEGRERDEHRRTKHLRQTLHRTPHPQSCAGSPATDAAAWSYFAFLQMTSSSRRAIPYTVRFCTHKCATSRSARSGSRRPASPRSDR